MDIENLNPHKGWYQGKYLPHFDAGNIYQFITYRLADSIPKEKLKILKKEIERLPTNKREHERRKQIEAWLDAGFGKCILNKPECAQIVIENWKHFDKIRYNLIAWVVMPNHVHVLIFVYHGWPMYKIVNSWTGYTGRQINKIINPIESAFDDQTLTERRLNSFKRTRQVWHRDYWDRFIRDEKHFVTAKHYIENNPIAAGLVKNAVDWPYSSANSCSFYLCCLFFMTPRWASFRLDRLTLVRREKYFCPIDQSFGVCVVGMAKIEWNCRVVDTKC